MHYLFEFIALIVLGILAIANLLAVVWLQVSKSFLSEVAESFPAQVAGLSALLALMIYIFTNAIQSIVWLNLLTIASVIPAVLLLIRILIFAFKKEPTGSSGNTKVRIGSFNKQIGTPNSVELVAYANELKLDLIGVSEVKSEDFKHLKSSGYRYHYHTDKAYGLGRAEFFILSRFKLENITHFSLDRFGNGIRCEIAVGSKKAAVYLIHTTAPISPELYHKRNEGFEILTEKLQAEKLKHIIMFGDLNLTPYSWVYRRFTKSLGKKLFNATKGWGYIFTWVYFKPFYTQLDHIFVSRNMSVSNFKVGKNLGSDHNLIWSDLKI